MTSRLKVIRRNGLDDGGGGRQLRQRSILFFYRLFSLFWSKASFPIFRTITAESLMKISRAAKIIEAAAIIIDNCFGKKFLPNFGQSKKFFSRSANRRFEQNFGSIITVRLNPGSDPVKNFLRRFLRYAE